jgi:membrane-associated phospholipid phosphatase
MRARQERVPSGIVVLAIGVLLAMVPIELPAQTAPSGPEAHHFNGRYLGKMGLDFTKVVLSPFHWKGKDLLLFGAAAGTTALVMAFADHGTREWVEDHQHTPYTRFSLFITRFGEAPVLVGLSALLYGGGEASGDDGLRKTGLLCLESYVINGVIVTAEKLLLGRSRPTSGEGPSAFHWFSFKNHEHSFPSGHASSAFAVASVIAGRSDSVLVGVFAYGLASLVAVSRVNNNEHWASDVVAGSIMGYFIGKQVLSLNRSGGEGRPALTVSPSPGGLTLSLRF